MYRLIYVSREVEPFNLQRLTQLLPNVQHANQTAGITGVLFYCQGIFLQLLEGPRNAVEGIMGKIEKDPRHTAIICLVRKESTHERLFPDWRMGFFHMSSIEPLFENGLVPNDPVEMERILDLADHHDPERNLLATFWNENRKMLRPIFTNFDQ